MRQWVRHFGKMHDLIPWGNAKNEQGRSCENGAHQWLSSSRLVGEALEEMSHALGKRFCLFSGCRCLLGRARTTALTSRARSLPTS